MALDRWIAAAFLAAAIVYAYAAFTYPLLPFERNMVFLPNTWPKVLSVAAIVLSAAILLLPKPKTGDGDDVLGSIDLAKFKEYKVGQAVGLLIAMVLYALALRPAGFLASTVIFLVGTGWLLGERQPLKMIAIAAVAAGVIWYLVEGTLGIYLRPLPAFIG